ncbi:MAG: type II secretion system protein N [Betaproteobacteria bacterium]
MVEIPPKRSNFAQSALVFAVTLATLMLLCAILAYWTWAWLAPRPAPVARAADDVQPRLDTAYSLFGGARRTSTAAVATPAIRILGVVAASGGKSGYAIVQLDSNRILAAREGTDIAPGIRLAQVQAGQIILVRNGMRETLALPEKK